MKYLTLTLRQPRTTRHPMQNYIADSDAVARGELLAWNFPSDTAVDLVLFYVEGEIDPYREAISEVESVAEFTLIPVDSDSFYVYITQEPRDADRQFREAFARRHLLVVPPVEYTGEGHMRFTAVGEPDDLRAMVADLPERIDAEIAEVGDYDRRHATVAGALTDRQFEAASVASALGYYEVPREASLAEVAAELDCAESTASNLLRKAESKVVSRVVDE